MTKYYMFSQGEYSDYCVGGLCVTEENVPDGEFDRMKEEYETQYKKLLTQAYIAHGERTGVGHNFTSTPHGKIIGPVSYDKFYKSFEYGLLCKWRVENNPQEVFKAKYNLVEVPYEECWE